ncbi:MAG: hypothetical protein JWO03_1992 [Bacteroidetes bacterium]|nr:hypothetical protein [Bacteroidota bacterium]
MGLMSNEEIEKAIAKGRLPFFISDYIFIGILVLINVLGAATLVVDNSKVLPVFAICSLFPIIMAGLTYNRKRLTIYSSSQSLSSKQMVISNLMDVLKATGIGNNEGYCQFIFGGGWFSNDYSITIIYTQSAYYLNCISASGRNSPFYGTNKETLKKIIKILSEGNPLDADLPL